MMKHLKLGETVISKYGPAKIIKIELCDKPGDKYGVDISSIPVDLVDRCIFDLDNGHWQYGTDIDFVGI